MQVDVKTKNSKKIKVKALVDSRYTHIVSQTSFSLYLHNQWTDFHKPSCVRKPKLRAICTYARCTKATTND